MVAAAMAVPGSRSLPVVMAVMADCSSVPVVSAGRAAPVVCWVAAAVTVGPAGWCRAVVGVAVMVVRPAGQAVSVVTVAAAAPPGCCR